MVSEEFSKCQEFFFSFDTYQLLIYSNVFIIHDIFHILVIPTVGLITLTSSRGADSRVGPTSGRPLTSRDPPYSGNPTRNQNENLSSDAILGSVTAAAILAVAVFLGIGIVLWWRTRYKNSKLTVIRYIQADSNTNLQSHSLKSNSRIDTFVKTAIYSTVKITPINLLL